MCGPAPGFSDGAEARGLVQLVAHHRDAYLGNSHILVQPADVLERAQPQ